MHGKKKYSIKIHGMIYNIKSGIIKTISSSIKNNKDISIFYKNAINKIII